MLAHFFSLSLSNDFSYLWAEYGAHGLMNSTLIFDYFKIYWRFQNGNWREIPNKNKGYEFYQGISLNTTFHFPENQNMMIVELSISNNGTSDKSIDFEVSFRPKIGNNNYIERSIYGFTNGVKLIDPKSGNGYIYMISDNFANADEIMWDKCEVHAYSTTTNPNPQITNYNVVTRWDDKVISDTESSHFYVYFKDFSDTSKSSTINISTIINETYNKDDFVSLSGTLEGFEIGQQITLVSKFANNENQIIGNYTVTEEETEFPFTYDMFLPNKGVFTLMFWALSQNCSVSNVQNIVFYVTMKPILSITSHINSVYYPGSSILVDLTVSADRGTYLCYRFDTNDESCFGYHYSNINGANYSESITVPRLSEDIHNVTFRSKNDYGIFSLPITYEFTIMNRNPPSLGFDPKPNQYTYYFYENFTCYISARGFQNGENITVWQREGTYGEYTPIYNFIYNGDPNKVFVNFKIPYKVYDTNLMFYCSDQYNVTSSSISHTLYIRKDFRVELYPLQRYYISGSKFNITGFVGDFDPGTEVFVNMRWDPGSSIYPQHEKLVMKDDYKSNDFNIEITAPDRIGSTKLILYCGTGDSLYRASVEYRITTTKVPIIHSYTPLEDTYSLNGFIDIEFTAFAATDAYIYYKYDEGNFIKLDQTIRFIDNNLTTTQSIPLSNQNLEIGPHNITLYLIDYYGCSSKEIIRHEFLYDDRNPPSLRLYLRNRAYKFSDYYRFTLYYHDKDPESFVNVYYWIDSTEPQELFNFTSSRYEQSREISLPAPRINGTHTLYLRAIDNTGAKSRIVSITSEINQNPGVTLNKLHNSRIQYGDNITMTVTVSDFHPGKEFYPVLKFYNYQLNLSHLAVTMPESMIITYDLTFEAPKIDFSGYFKIFMVQDGWECFTGNSEIKISQRPELYILNELDPQYSIGEVITVDVKVWDEDTCHLKYKFDEDNKIYTLDRIKTNNENITRRYQIPTADRIYNVGDKVLSIYCEDPKYFTSEVFTHKFKYESLYAPQLEVKILNQKNIYYFHESLKLRFRLRDRNYGDEIKIMMKVNNSEFENILNVTSYAEWQDVYYTFVYPSEERGYSLVFYANDNTDSASQESKVEFKVVQKPVVVVTSSIEGMYDPGTSVEVTCFAGDFAIGDVIEFYYKINNDKQVDLPESFVINDNYSTDFYTFTMKLPTYTSRNSIYIYAKNHNNVVGERAILYTTTNYLPKIIDIQKIKHEYASNEFIDIDCTLYDDTYVYMYYRYDTRQDSQIGIFSINGKELQIHKQIPVPKEKFRGGTHKLYVYFVDAYGKATETKEFEFVYNDKHAPEFSAKLINKKNYYGFYDLVKFNFSVVDQDNGNTVRILMKVNGSNFTEIHSFVSNAENYNYSYEFEIPNIDGVCIVHFIARDETEASSVDQIFEIHVKKSPIVVIENDLSGSYEGGETVNIKGFVADFEPGTAVQVLYSFSGGNPIYATPFINTKEDYMTDEFNFDIKLPTDVGTHTVTFWAEDSGRQKSYNSRQFITVNLGPKIVEWETLREPTYYMNGFIEFDAILFDDSRSMIYYRFDHREVKSLDEWISLDRINKQVNKEIPIPTDLTVGTHELTVYLQDWFGVKSETKTQSFTFSNRSVPVLKMKIDNYRNVYMLTEEISFSGTVIDYDAEDTTTVTVQIDNGELKQIAEFESSNVSHDFNHKIKLPLVAGDHVVVFKAHDSTGGESGEQRFNIKTQQQPTVIVTSEVLSQYIPNETISVSGYIADFSPNEEVQLFFRLNDGITEYAALSMISDENYKTPSFEFSTTLPDVVRRNTLTIWADSSSGASSKRSYFTIITNRAPSIREWQPIKKVNSRGEFIELNALVTDDSNCMIYYNFDDNSERKINEMLPIRSKDFPVVKQIAIDGNNLDIGQHNLTVWVKDEFGLLSENITQQFELVNYHAPEIVLNALPKRGPYNYHEKITFTGSVRDLDEGDDVKVGFKVGSSEIEIIYDTISDGQWHDFSHTFDVPHADGEFNIFVAAMDQTQSKSEEVSLPFKVAKNPGVKFLKPLKKSYSPGETMHLTSMLVDFEANSPVLFCYSIDGDGKNFISEVEIFENMTSGIVNYEVSLPNVLQDHYLILWAENELGHVLCSYNENYLIMNYAPTMNITNTLPTELFGHAFIEVDASVYDDTDVWVYYRIDNSGEFKISTKIQSFFEIEKRVLTIEIPENSLSEDSHTLYLYVKDEFEATSEPIVHQFTYSNSQITPELKVETKIKSYTYGYFEKIDFTAIMNSASTEDTIELYMRIDYEEYQKIYEYKSEGKEVSFKHTFQVPPVDDFHFFTLVARNQNGVSSKISKFDFESRMNPGLEFTEPVKVSYRTDEQIKITGYAVDYNPGTLLDVFYQLDSEEKKSGGRVRINGEFKTNLFTFTLHPNASINIHYVSIWIESEGKSVYSIGGNFIVNSKPKLVMKNIPNGIYYTNDHINLDFSVYDNTYAKICYQFDEGEEKYLSDSIHFFKKEYEFRKQILINSHVINPGPHKLYVYALDEFGEKSDYFVHDFTYENVDAPELVIESFERKKVYNFYEKIIVRGRARDTSRRGNTKVYYRFNFSQPVEIDTSQTVSLSKRFPLDANEQNEWKQFETTISVPQKNEEYFLILYAQDENGATSIDTRHDFKVQFNPCIKLLNSVERSYMPGDKVTISGFAGDFEQGKTLSIFYKLGEQEAKKISDLEVFDNMTTGEFNFDMEIPTAVTPQSFKIWAQESDKVVAVLDKGYEVINLTPRLKINNKVSQRYFNKGFIDLDVSVWDNTRVMLYYCIDGNREINLTDYIDCNNNWENRFIQIELPPGSYKFGSHKLYIFVRDEFGAESSDTVYDFILIDEHAPDMEILNITTKETFSYYEIVTLYGRVKDDDPEDKIFVNLQINGNGYTEIFATIATGEWQNFSYTFNVPRNDGLHIVTFQAQDNWTAASRISRYNFKVGRSHGISFRNSFPQYYEPAATIKLEGRLTDIPKNRKVRVEGRFGATRFYIDVFTIHNTMTFKDFNFNFDIPSNAKNDDLEILVVDNETNQVLNSIKQPIIINEKPQFWLLNEIPNKFVGATSFGLDIVVNDDSQANLRYRIDNGEEINMSDMIICNTLNITTRQTLKIPGDLERQNHSITIYAVDDLGLPSDTQIYSFLFYNSNFNAPELTIDEFEDRDYYINENITANGYLFDKDVGDDVKVYIRYDFDEFIEIHKCPYSTRKQCEHFNYSFHVPKSTGSHYITFQAIDSRNATSEDCIFKINVIKHNVERPSPPVPIPRPSPLLPHFSGSMTTTIIITYRATITTDINGDPYTTYLPMKEVISYSIEVTNSSTEEIKIDFFDTVFGKYILWPVIVCVVLVIIAVIVIVIILKKKQAEESESESLVEMAAETMQIGTDTCTNEVTNENPLFTNTKGEDDPFKDDFQENDKITDDIQQTFEEEDINDDNEIYF